MSTIVLKVGGRPLADIVWLRSFAAGLKELRGSGNGTPVRVVVVHGGGPEVDDVSTRLGIPVERVNGLRVTTPASLDVASMVLSGRLNKRLVSALLDAEVDAVGLAGEDGGLLEAVPMAERDVGRVGRVARVRTELLELLLAQGITPVVSPISRGPGGVALNVNADEAAMAVARALGAATLLYLTDVVAVRDGERELSELGRAHAAALLANGVARDGMAVKVASALEALDAGVPVVRIGALEMLTDERAGTRVSAFEEVSACEEVPA